MRALIIGSGIVPCREKRESEEYREHERYGGRRMALEGLEEVMHMVFLLWISIDFHTNTFLNHSLLARGNRAALRGDCETYSRESLARIGIFYQGPTLGWVLRSDLDKNDEWFCSHSSHLSPHLFCFRYYDGFEIRVT